MSYDFPAIAPVHRMFLHMLIASNGYLRQDKAQAVLAELVRSNPFCTNALQASDISVKGTVDALNPGLEFFDMHIAYVRSESDGRLYLVYSNTKSDALAMGVGASDKEESVAVMKVVLNYLVAKE